MSDLIPGPGGLPHRARGIDAAGLDDRTPAEGNPWGPPVGTASGEWEPTDGQPPAARTRAEYSPTAPAPQPPPPQPPTAPTAPNESTDPAESAEPAGTIEPTTPSPLGVPRAPTGSEAIDTLLERLADADHLPASGHLEVYEDVHRGLRDALTALDAHSDPVPAPGPQPPPADHRS